MTGAARLLVAGTSSDAGKSAFVTGLCRVLSDRGLSVAPFKAQNMANNSMVIGDGLEIGRAQWIQAVAARAEPEVAMNPVLLKPGGDRTSFVIVDGKPGGRLESSDWIEGRRHLAEAAHAAFDDLSSRYDVVICEGAGSPTEINLRSADYVNMGLARHGGIPTIVVGDIDRGGVFASLYGTVALLEPADQRLIAGFVLNKFRGDPTLLDPAIQEVERVTGRRFFGTIPFSPGRWIDTEDAYSRPVDHGLGFKKVGVVDVPNISNFTDIDALRLEPGLAVDFVSDPARLAACDLIVLPGTRATFNALHWLEERGLDQVIVDHALEGRPVLGICGGCQILGGGIDDSACIEYGYPRHVSGLGLLSLSTEFQEEKVLRHDPVLGYEVHHGRVTADPSLETFHGGYRDDKVFGTMWHGSLENDDFRRTFLAEALGLETSGVSFPARREQQIDDLAWLVREHVDVDALLELATNGVPDLPVIGPHS